MALYGHINEFKPSEGTINDYIDRLDFYLEANEVTEVSKKRAILLTAVGPQQFRLLKDLTAPEKPVDKSYDALCMLLKQPHEPESLKFLQRAKFDARLRKDNESISEYVAALRKLSEHCQFGATLNNRLCERFVTGVSNNAIQRKLLLETDLTLDKAVTIAISISQTNEGAKSLESGQVHAISNKFKSNSSKQSHYRHGNGQGYQHKPAQTQQVPCHRCGGPHSPHRRKFKSAACCKRSKQGHIPKACLSKKHSATTSVKSMHSNHFVGSASSSDSQADSNADDTNFHLFIVSSDAKTSPINVEVLVNTTPIIFQVDTGASLSIINLHDYQKFLADSPPLMPSSKQLHTYTGHQVKDSGECSVKVSYQQQQISAILTVVENGGPPLLGRDWLRQLRLGWSSLIQINNMRQSQTLDDILLQNSSVFGESGVFSDRNVKILLKENAVPKYCKARTPPFAMRDKIEQELARLEKNGIIKKVESSERATPIVPVLKKDNTVRICGDYKVTINPHIQQNRHPILVIEDLSHKLSGGERFTELDLSHAYTQLELDGDSKKLTTLNTHMGLYQYQRLCFGISSSLGIFQEVMDSTFQSVPNVAVYFDNLYITGMGDDENLDTLNKVLSIIKEKGLKINKNKCQFMLSEIKFLGYRLNKQGLQPQPEKVNAIKLAPQPENVSQLRAYLGLVNYYSKFVPNLSQTLAPLNKLLKKNEKWAWGQEQDKAFQKSKDIISSDNLIIHFDPTKNLTLTCDASPDGIGAVLSHGELPIAFASRSLNQAERNYSQLDREGLSIIFGGRKFHKFVYGREITIITDHKPLLGLFGENKPLPGHTSPGLQRWAITLLL